MRGDDGSDCSGSGGDVGVRGVGDSDLTSPGVIGYLSFVLSRMMKYPAIPLALTVIGRTSFWIDFNSEGAKRL